MAVKAVGFFVGGLSEVSGDNHRLMIELEDGTHAAVSGSIVVNLMQRFRDSTLMEDLRLRAIA